MHPVLISATNLRKSLTSVYRIDHIVELQLISAVLIEHNIGDPNNDYEMFAAAKFAKYFNKRWNLQIISKQENEEKKDAVCDYIRWKYDHYPCIPNNYVFNIIANIFNEYCANRDEILYDINTDEIGHRRKFREVENSLFRLLKFTDYQNSSIRFQDIVYETNALYDSLVKMYSLDHIVELQILSSILASNKITDIHLAVKFTNYFNENWNFQIIHRNRNSFKGENIKKWLEWYHSNSEGNLKSSVIESVNFVYRHYKRNRHYVRDDIMNDEYTNEIEKKLFLKIEADLFNMLKP